MPTRVALDAMGGDHAPDVVVEGAVRAARARGGALQVLLVGQEEPVRAALQAHDTEGLPLQVVPAAQVIGMDESPAAALKGKPESSIHIGIGMCKRGMADAFASAGNTGAVMAAAAFGLGRVEGVQRPSLPSYFPSVDGRTVLVLDVGANVDARPEQIAQFGRMGSVFAQRVLGIDDPAVGLLNIGEEESKGTEAVKEAHALLAEAPGIRFVGNVEGRDILRGAADVVACDGFVGNIVLKLAESVATVLPEMIGRQIAKDGLDEDATALVARTVRGAVKGFDYEQYGGVPLLGIDGSVVIGHGSSSASAIENMVYAAATLAEQDVAAHIGEALAA